MIDWSNKIITENNTEYIDVEGMVKHFPKYSKKPKTVKIEEYDVPLPDEPPLEECINYGINDENEQIFRKFLIPKQVRNPQKDYGRENWTQARIDSFIDLMWHIRLNGCWMIIKNKKTYIPGLLVYKLVFTDVRNKFIYKYSDWEFFMFWGYCLMCYECKGMIDFKCRQLGDTQNVLTIIYEYGTRSRGMLNTMQSAINEKNIQMTYDRLVEMHKNMVYFFKPMHQGKEDPKDGLVLRYPTDLFTHKKVKEKALKGEIITSSSSDDYEFPEVNTRFQYGATKERVFDGATDLGRVYLDEYGKPSSGFSPSEWVRVMIEAIFSKITGRKTGMLLLTSTVDEITSDTLEESKTMWESANPSKRLSTGSTVSGLFRIFRGVVARGDVDRWGFPLTEKILAETTEQYNAMIASGDTRGAFSYIQKNPRTIEDVFVSALNQSQFNIKKLNRRLIYINEQSKPLFVRGNFRWENGVKWSNVVWEPDPNGRWTVSMHPSDLGLYANAKLASIYSPKPANINHFCCGVDPIDQAETLESDENRSKGAIVVKAKLNPMIDSGEGLYYDYDDPARDIHRGNPVEDGANFTTNRIVCCYLARPEDPTDFFDDVAKTVIYYGTDFLPEKNKFGGLHNYLKNNNHDLYIMDTKGLIRNYKGQSESDGISANTKSINTYFELLSTLTNRWCNTIDHPDLLMQLMSMNWKNRGKRDLGVAAGFCELADTLPRLKYKPQEQTEIQHFTEREIA